jgi:hypothetical protein
VLLALFVVSSAQTPFVTMEAKGDVSVDDAGNPAKLSSEVKATFRLGANSNGLNPLAEDLKLNLQYGGIVGPMYIVFVPAGCFTQVGKDYRVQMQDFHNCGVSIKLMNVFQPNDIVELLPYCNRFDLRLGPGPEPWDLSLTVDFIASTPNGPIAAVMAVLRSPLNINLLIGDDGGDINIGKIEFKGD